MSGYRRQVVDGRLRYYGQTADRSFWADNWTDGDIDRLMKRGAKGHLGYLDDLLTAHLPTEGRILEAGCGAGHIVAALRARGYDCEGVEWSGELVERVHRLAPGIPIRQGDVTRLDVPDGHYTGVVSLGVIEHRLEGPEPFLEEANRILAAGGKMLVSVPYFNLIRRMRYRLGSYREPIEALDFYQQAFSPADLIECLRASGFVVDAVSGYDCPLGLTSEFGFGSKLFRLPVAGIRLKRGLERSLVAKRIMAHMLAVACRKG